MKNQNAKKIHIDLNQQYGSYFVVKEVEIKNKKSNEKPA